VSETGNRVFEPLFGKKVIQEALAKASRTSKVPPLPEIQPAPQARPQARPQVTSPAIISKLDGLWEDKNKLLMIAAVVILVIIIVVLLFKQKDQNKKVTRLALEMKKMRSK